jgi:hypothetical protein
LVEIRGGKQIVETILPAAKPIWPVAWKLV